MAQSDNNQQSINSGFLIALIAQVGCLTLIIILVSLLGGLWLDNTFGTKPVFTLIFLLAGTPLSVIAMLAVARRAVAKLKTQSNKNGDDIAGQVGGKVGN